MNDLKLSNKTEKSDAKNQIMNTHKTNNKSICYENQSVCQNSNRQSSRKKEIFFNSKNKCEFSQNKSENDFNCEFEIESDSKLEECKKEKGNRPIEDQKKELLEINSRDKRQIQK